MLEFRVSRLSAASFLCGSLSPDPVSLSSCLRRSRQEYLAYILLCVWFVVS